MRYLLLCLFFVSWSLEAANVGLGASAKDSDASIYVPIDVSTRFRVEPYLRRYKIGSATVPDAFPAPGLRYGTSVGFVAVSSSTWRSSTKSLAVGTGAFVLTRQADDAVIYYGGRVAYQKSETTTHSSGPEPIGTFQPVAIGATFESDGFAITPTAGLEYYPVERFSIAIEIGWEFSRTDSSSTVTGSPGSQSELEEDRTRANVILRFFF